MKYVYVLVSGEQDLYYEQALMSVYSLTRLMPGADVVLLTDDRTEKSLCGKRNAIRDFGITVISVPFEESVPNADRSRLIKTSIPDYVKEDFLYIDCDTIIADDLSSIEDCPYSTAGVLDGHVLLDEHIHKKYFLSRDKKIGFHGTEKAGYNINGGLVFARANDEGRELFKKWNELWKYSAYQKHDKHDQSALNEANLQTGLKMGLLDGEWNCQPSHGGLAFLKDAKIIHYYSSEFSGKNYVPYYKLADKTLQNKIKETGILDDTVKAMIAEPKFQFNKVHIVNDSRIVGLMQSPLLFTLADIKAKVPWLFNILESQVSFIRSTAKKLIKR